jgi:glycosyltransferase involved in cell wall biosynthesis
MTDRSWDVPAPDAMRVLMTTEGTYPFVVGGVSTWCDLLVTGLPQVRWQLLAITAGAERTSTLFTLPPNLSWAGHVELWDEAGPGRLRARRGAAERTLPSRLVGLVGWDSPLDDVLDALVWCRTHPDAIADQFGAEAGWDGFLDRLRTVLAQQDHGSAPAPDVDLHSAAVLYQTLYWIARTAATPTPETDLCHVTAAGWAGVPAVVHKALHGTPLLLTEHGVYVREAYLGAIRSDPHPAQRFLDTRLARGLTRLAYQHADVISPVTGAHTAWEQHLTRAQPTVIPIPNGVPTPPAPVEPAHPKRVVSVGRLDPLKDVATLLRVAAEVCRQDPDTEFLHYGPVTLEQEGYARACYALHEELALGDRFRFMGSTTVPREVMREAGVVILTSISEGFPMAVLEALSEARPVVATAVGGVAEALEGCGLVAPPGRVHDLADAVLTLLRHPDLARDLGRRGHRRTATRYRIDTTLDSYELLFEQLREQRTFA